MNQVIKNIALDLREKDNFLITTHLNPDGDALGSQLALGAALECMGKKVYLVNADHTPYFYQFLPGAGEIRHNLPSAEVDTVIFMECPDPSRAGRIARKLESIKTIINIDHHFDNKKYGHMNYVDGNAEAAAMQILNILDELKVSVDKDMAMCLYVGLVTDTGNFTYANTTSKVLRTAALLIDKGINPTEISQKIFEANSINKFKLLSLTLNTLEFSSDGKIASIVITLDMLHESNAKSEDIEGFINIGRSVKGVEVSIVFREVKGGKVKASFRSKKNFDVNQIAAKFNGGGHKLAAGCLLEGAIDDVKKKVMQEINLRLKEHEDNKRA